jgi:hypothetical protein
MRLARVRFTIRRMMIVVAVAGLTFGCLVWLLPHLKFLSGDAFFHDSYVQVGHSVPAASIARLAGSSPWPDSIRHC